MIWNYVFFAVVALYIYKNIPKPKSIKPPGLGDIDVPTADPSRDIPVIFGTVDVKSPNTVWYGNLKTVAIKEKSGGK